jgi:glycosyltransferase involved in cell wall biosynthesis
MASTKDIKYIVIFATADWNERYWTNKQHSAIAFSKLGIHVLYIESIGLRRPRFASKRDLKRIRQRLFLGIRTLIFGPTQVSDGIRVLSPLTIPGVSSGVILKSINRWFLWMAIKRSMLSKLLCRPVIWTYHPYIFDVIDIFNREALVYHCVDDLSKVPGVNGDDFKSAEMNLITKADAIFATSRNLFEYCKNHNSATFFSPNVADYEHFSQAIGSDKIPDDLQEIPEPRICFHGVLSDFKIDFNLLKECAELTPDWSWVLIGEEREGQRNDLVKALRSLKNVYFLGYKAYEELPMFLGQMQVGILPNLVNEYTAGMFPMKYNEYVMAGLPVVSTDLDFTQSLGDDIQVADNARGFVSKIEDILNNRNRTIEKRHDVSVVRTWDERAKIMISILGRSLRD